MSRTYPATRKPPTLTPQIRAQRAETMREMRTRRYAYLERMSDQEQLDYRNLTRKGYRRTEALTLLGRADLIPRCAECGKPLWAKAKGDLCHLHHERRAAPAELTDAERADYAVARRKRCTREEALAVVGRPDLVGAA